MPEVTPVIAPSAPALTAAVSWASCQTYHSNHFSFRTCQQQMSTRDMLRATVRFPIGSGVNDMSKHTCALLEPRCTSRRRRSRRPSRRHRSMSRRGTRSPATVSSLSALACSPSANRTVHRHSVDVSPNESFLLDFGWREEMLDRVCS